MERAEARKLYEEIQKLKIFELEQKILDTLDSVPKIEGMYIKSVNPLVRSYERGVKVAVHKPGRCDWIEWEYLKHNAYVIYADLAPTKFWIEKTDETVAEQLFTMYVYREIDEKTMIRFSFVDFMEHSHNNTIERTIEFEKLLPYIVEIIQKKKEELEEKIKKSDLHLKKEQETSSKKVRPGRKK